MHCKTLGASWTDILETGIRTAGDVFSSGGRDVGGSVPVFSAPTTSGQPVYAEAYPPSIQQRLDAMLGWGAPAPAATPGFAPYSYTGGLLAGGSGLLLVGAVVIGAVMLSRRRRR